jgi:hypothetical protein
VTGIGIASPDARGPRLARFLQPFACTQRGRRMRRPVLEQGLVKRPRGSRLRISSAVRCASRWEPSASRRGIAAAAMELDPPRS